MLLMLSKKKPIIIININNYEGIICKIKIAMGGAKILSNKYDNNIKIMNYL